ncbi:high choriolytic enzyme 1-like [Centropristis striata]|uniref:high choriolytic enzyme 1-like n=1 Tax=Centropristis striata TaxID=184440 RepID=UPI0027DFEF53|nr:high choriolytic enzyme 1-like [Centropristis striata]
MMLQAAVFSVLFCSVHSFTIQASLEKSEESSCNTIEDDAFSVSTLIEKANINVGKNFDDPLVMFGDIAVPTGLENADPCTARRCKWQKYNDGKVYVPYRISDDYSQRQRQEIMQGMQSFAECTCIRFFPVNREEDFLDILPRTGCWSFVGRRGGRQEVSLERPGCIHRHVIQHELLHALGFQHEQSRSDRDQHVRILLQNVESGKEHAFDKVQTNNLNTPYDYNSVMHYGRDAFSRNGQPTIIPIPDENVCIGRATKMSPNDILRVNRLYCSSTAARSHLDPVQRNHFL